MAEIRTKTNVIPMKMKRNRSGISNRPDRDRSPIIEEVIPTIPEIIRNTGPISLLYLKTNNPTTKIEIEITKKTPRTRSRMNGPMKWYIHLV
jgi:hypothetical protein